VNSIHLLVQIVKEIEHNTFDDGTFEKKYLAIPIKKDKKKESIFLSFSIWEKNDVIGRNFSEKSYKVNDLVLIEGFLGTQDTFQDSFHPLKNGLFDVSVLNHSIYY